MAGRARRLYFSILLGALILLHWSVHEADSVGGGYFSNQQGPGAAVTQMLTSRRNPEKRAAPGGKFINISGGRIAGGGGGLSSGFRPTFDYKAYMARKEQRDKDRIEYQAMYDKLPDLSSEELAKLKWWSDIEPSRLKSRLPHHKRPPNLLSPGVFNFKQEKSPEYYFHRSGARILKSSHFYMRYHLGRKISFVCVAEGYPRPQITWLKDGLELNSYAGYDAVGINEWRQGLSRIKSKLEIDPAMPKDTGFYECLADNKFSIDRRGFIAKYELN